MPDYGDDYRVAAIVLSFYYPNYKAEDVFKCLLLGNEESCFFNTILELLDELTYSNAKEFNRIINFVTIIINAMKINFWKDIFLNECWYTNDFSHLEKEAWKIKYQEVMEFE